MCACVCVRITIPCLPTVSPRFGHDDEFGGSSDYPATQTGSTFTAQGMELDREESRKAKVLYDYDAANENELTIFTDQVCPV